MSAGAKVVRAYSADYDNTQNHPITVDEQTLELEIGGVANGDALGGINTPISAVVSRGKRSFGLNARTVSVKFDEGAAPAGYSEGSIIRLPWLRPATFGAITRGQAGTYLGADIRVIGKSPESVR